MIKLAEVTKDYPGQSKVLDKIELELNRGDFVYVLGGTGAGKSTLLRLMATEESPTCGVISLFGYDLGRISPGALRAIRQSLGYIPQNIRLIPDFTVRENISLSLSLAGRRARGAGSANRVDELLERVGLKGKADKLAWTLSGGEAQRVAVARALVRSPELIIADEPTGAQDRNQTWGLMELLVKMNLSGSTVVVATHDQEIIRRVRNRCLILKNGNVHREDFACTY